MNTSETPITGTIIALEVGSTYTKLAAFTVRDGVLDFLGRTATRTSIDQGDVRRGVDDLLKRAAEFGVSRWDRAYLTSSAAGGLRVAVSGLTPTLSTKVGLEIALGAGGVVVHSAAGRLRAADLTRLRGARPGLVLVCGGTDHGESSVVLDNVAALAASKVDAVFLYAGNTRVREEARDLLERAGRRCLVTDNVYPESDRFRFDEARHLIRDIFEAYVVKAPGIDELSRSLEAGCEPTPLAVSRAVEVMASELGDGLLAVDVGGATTDVHSLTPGQPAPDTVRATFEPPLKRTVEGDLGVFHNLRNLLPDDWTEPVPHEPIVEAEPLREYAFRAARRALARHAGRAVRSYGAATAREIVHGVDLRPVRAVLATGGALRAALSDPRDMSAVLSRPDSSRLMPEEIHHWLVDRHYLVSSLGALCPDYAMPVHRFVREGLKKGLWS